MVLSETINVTGLGAVYAGDDPLHFDAALQSLYLQTVRLREIVIVQDGPVGNGILEVIESWQDKLPIRVIELEANMGLAEALNRGLYECSHEIIMRFDADDINRSDRLEKQLSLIRKNSSSILVSGAIEEFTLNPGDLGLVRRSALTTQVAERKAVWSSPINHAATCFLKSEIIELGGYPAIPFMEDYALWLKCLGRGMEISSCSDVLVDVRVGNGMIERRRGMRYMVSEWEIFLTKVQIYGVFSLNTAKSIVSFVLRSGFRFMPVSFLAAIYKKTRTQV